MTGAREDIRDFLRRVPAAVLVEVTGAAGSTPRDTDAWMLVSERAIFATIGGGQLEYMAIDQARRALRSGLAAAPMTVPLGPEIGQCCGGRVGLSFAAVTPDLAARLIARCDQEMASRPHVYVFGAGHVGDALALALSLAPLRVVLVDTREDALEASTVPRIETCLTPMPEAVVRDAPAGSSFVILTHDHALDFLIAAEALKRPDAAYVGMIGSKTKRATFRNWLSRESGNPALSENLVCPIGGTTIKDKRPAVIATLAAAEILTAALAWRARSPQSVADTLAGSSPSSLPIRR
ncbi:xanthine dehydrogenase accessory protein XdhC [Shinella sumterensis]|uniref:Xanthine dehydrogenase accessory protein XdhC n=1 Tax=Shinella sumterensis TaxID=1967501 RepID=A0AA50H565_9HYPH|nr:xanthine dehydrogenase accessory protein XdhC [Shinella sumterensis]MCD1265097.1 xanthine dehydrogenase accessory protein XdhC [Shinella sumterensis]TFE97096.1 xanthine dehydrogenase accessory protein XdhC [Shinella sumterensis]WLR96933.1 xanthine dehydrogenase accessory protein XdhC [Shinella sumterensis]